MKMFQNQQNQSMITLSKKKNDFQIIHQIIQPIIYNNGVIEVEKLDSENTTIQHEIRKNEQGSSCKTYIEQQTNEASPIENK